MGMDGGGSIQTQSIKNLEKGIVMKKARLISRRILRGNVVLSAWRHYCMESWIFRLFVKLGLRK